MKPTLGGGGCGRGYRGVTGLSAYADLLPGSGRYSPGGPPRCFPQRPCAAWGREKPLFVRGPFEANCEEGTTVTKRPVRFRRVEYVRARPTPK